MNNKVRNLISKYTEKGSIASSDSLTEDLGIDSLNMVQLLLDIEDTFCIKLDDSDLNPYDLTTVSSVEALVNKYIKAV